MIPGASGLKMLHIVDEEEEQKERTCHSLTCYRR